MINRINTYLDDAYFEFTTFKQSDLGIGKVFYSNEKNLSDEVAKQIKPLSLASSEAFWKNIISEKNLSRVQLDQSDWICNLKWKGFIYWLDNYNKGEYKKIEKLLREYLNWNQDLPVYFCCGYSDIIKTTWSIFTQYWMNFVEYEDDGPILLAEKKREIITITPLGYFNKSIIA